MRFDVLLHGISHQTIRPDAILGYVHAFTFGVAIPLCNEGRSL